MRVVFLGTPAFAAKTLAYLLDHDVHVVGVVSQPPRPKGRSKEPIPSPVMQLATERGIPLFSLEDVPEADLFVVVAYGEYLGKSVREKPRLACINVHPSLLPKYRGAAPMQRAIMNGDTKTGVSIMHVAKEMDAGDLIRVGELSIGPDETLAELEPRLCALGCELLLSAIHDFEEERASRHPQEGEATYAAKIEPEECQLDWDRPAEEIHNLIRAVSPKPGAWCIVKIRGEDKRLKVLRSTLTHRASSLAVGKLQLLDVQLEGKKRVSADEFLRGYKIDDVEFQ